MGAPPSVLRERLRGSFGDRVKILEDVADGEVIQRADVPLHTVLQHAHCPKCGDSLKPNPDTKPADIVMLSLKGVVSATVSDRIKAIDLLAKYGLGTTKELTTDDVRDKLVATIAVVRNTLGEDDAERVLQGMRTIWA